jgi:MoxR-like ATPase
METACRSKERCMVELKEQLNACGYVCDQRFASAVQAALHTRPVAGAILAGPIGTGKSYLPEILARVLDTGYFFYQCFPGTREEDLLVKMLPSEATLSGIALHDGVILQAVRASCSEAGPQRSILMLDEWDKTRPSADSFLLDFLQSGRVNFADRSFTADLSRLIVFLTVNVERELSEPLMRRLPRIEFNPLSPSKVHRALQLTHRDHPYLYNAIVLYERCLMANLPKPATIQELRQLLDAVTILGPRADWDELVFQFVTKSEEAHEMLSRAESETSSWRMRSRVRLDVNAYDVRQKILAPEAGSAETLAMPRLAEIHGFDDLLAPKAGKPDMKGATGIIALNDEAYSAVVRLLDAPGARPEQLGEWGEVTAERLIRLKKRILLKEVEQLKGLWGENGEVLLYEPAATWQDVKALQQWAAILIVKFSRREILAKMEGIDLRWTRRRGAEIIVYLGRPDAFAACFGQSWGEVGEGKWIGRNGLIFKRYPRETPHA